MYGSRESKSRPGVASTIQDNKLGSSETFDVHVTMGGKGGGSTAQPALAQNMSNISSRKSLRRAGASIPHLVPQKTNVLTGACTSYFNKQPTAWKQDYEDLLAYRTYKVQTDSNAYQQHQSVRTSRVIGPTGINLNKSADTRRSMGARIAMRAGK